MLGDETNLKSIEAVLRLGSLLLQAPVALWTQDAGERLVFRAGGMDAAREFHALGEDFAPRLADINSKDGYVATVKSRGEKCETKVLYLPVGAEGIPRGVVGVLTEQLTAEARDGTMHIAQLLSQLVGEEAQLHHAERRLQLVKDASDTPDLRHSMEFIVKEARGVTGAMSAVVALADRSSNFAVTASSPEGSAIPVPRTRGGIAEAVLDRRQPIRIRDTHTDDRIRKEVKRHARSILAVPVLAQDDPVGAIFVYGRRCNEFTDQHQDFLSKLAECASVALGRWRAFLGTVDEIETATTNLIEFDHTTDKICSKIKEKFGFDFVALQVARKEEGLLETIKLVGLDKSWAGRSKHSLNEPTRFRDIQVDVFQSRRAEVIGGWDPRFDEWIYKRYGHEKFTRAFVPVVVALRAQGELAEEWNESMQHSPPEAFGADGQNYRVELIEPAGLALEVVGTLEAGFKSRRAIHPDTLTQLLRETARWAPKIWGAELSRVVEGILDRAMKLVRADSVTLHFDYERQSRQYRFQYAGRSDLARQLLQHSPRENGLGWEAITSEGPKFIEDPEELQWKNPAVFDLGVRSIGAFPLWVGGSVGMLYTHFEKQHTFSDNEIGWLTHLSRAAEAALQHTTAYSKLRDQAAKFEELPSMLATLTSVDEEDPLEQLARETLHVLGADVVTIYEFLAYGERFLTPPRRVGHLLRTGFPETRGPITREDVPMRLVEHRGNIYTNDPEKNRVLCSEHRQHGRDPFIKREAIKAVAAVSLKADDEVVGVMFVNFRRNHHFEHWERRMIETMAAGAALAIRMRRQVKSSEALAHLGEVAGGVAHELSNDASAAQRIIADLKRGIPDDNSPLLQLLGDTLESIIERTKQILRARYQLPGPVNLKGLIEASVKEVRAPGHLSVTSDVPDGIPTVRASANQLGAIFVELLRNAIRELPPGGKIHVSATRVDGIQGRSIRVHFDDDGPGVADAEKEAVFQRGHSRGGVTGFGLWWIRTYLNRLGGDVVIEDNKPKGTRLVLRLPASSEQT